MVGLREWARRIFQFYSFAPHSWLCRRKTGLRSTDFSANVLYWSADDVSHKLDYEQSLFFLGPSSKTPETRKWPGSWLNRRRKTGEALGLPPSFLASYPAQRSRVCTPLTKSEEKVRLPAVYTGSASDWPCHVENSLQPRHYPDLGARHRYKFPVW